MSQRSARSRSNSGSHRSTGYNQTVATTATGRRQSRSRRKSKSPAWWRATKIVLCIVTIIGLSAGCFGLFTFMHELQDASSEVQKFQQMRDSFQVKPSQIYSADGQLLYEIMAERREYVSFDAIPKIVRDSIVAAEDKRFYEHQGVDPWALARIVFVNGREGRMAQGGSTITMQLAKLVSENSQKTFQRKIHDMALAVATERQLQKNEILELYLNKVYFGNQAYGIKAAADSYFGKPLDKLTLGEAALLARLVRKPSSWSHLNKGVNLETAIKNRNIVLGIMLEEGMITQSAYDAALQEVPKFRQEPPRSTAHIYAAPYFVTHVKDVLKRDYKDVDLTQGGYRIDTTLDLGIQTIAEKMVRQTVREHRSDRVSTAAFVLMNSDGQILAEVGGVNYRTRKFNSIYQGKRPAGSSFKPFVYATAFLNGALTSLDEEISNEPFVLPAARGRKEWAPKNSNGQFSSSLSVREAFRNSWNIPAIRVMDKVGIQPVVRTCADVFGFTSKIEPYLPSALGASSVNPLEMAQAYSVFMLKGDRATPYTIRRITGPSGEIVHDPSPRIERNRLDPSVCDQIDTLMREVVENGTGKEAQIVPNAHGKTGTTNDNKDAWFCGYTDGLVGIGWVANEVVHKDGSVDYAEMGRRVFGGTVTVEFWASIMKAAHDKFGQKFAIRTDANVTKSEEQADEHRRKSEEKAKEKTEEKPPDTISTPYTAKAGAADDASGDNAAGTTDPNQDDSKMAPDQDKPAPDADAIADKPRKPKKKPVQPDAPADAPSTATDQREAEPLENVSYVTVEVCAESGKRATRYCNETVTRRFKKGTEPRTSCPIHRG